MKIYTKGGDKGYTSLIGGKRVPKYHERVEAYGSIDELMSFIALLLDSYDSDYYRDFLWWVQDRLMVCSSIMSADSEELVMKLPLINKDDISRLEKEIDKIDKGLPRLGSFILPGGHKLVSLCHICRTVCRRAERLSVRLLEKSGNDDFTLKYLNRLSDFFFVLSRQISKDFNVSEITWNPKG